MERNRTGGSSLLTGLVFVGVVALTVVLLMQGYSANGTEWMRTGGLVGGGFVVGALLGYITGIGRR